MSLILSYSQPYNTCLGKSKLVRQIKQSPARRLDVSIGSLGKYHACHAPEWPE